MHIIDLFAITLIIPILVIIIAGMVKYNEKIKQRIMCIFAFLYNFAIGVFDSLIAFAISSMRFSEGLRHFIIYMIFLIPINIFMKKKGKISLGIYLTIMITATVLGIIFLNTVVFEEYIVGK